MCSKGDRNKPWIVLNRPVSPALSTVISQLFHTAAGPFCGAAYMQSCKFPACWRRPGMFQCCGCDLLLARTRNRSHKTLLLRMSARWLVDSRSSVTVYLSRLIRVTSALDYCHKADEPSATKKKMPIILNLPIACNPVLVYSLSMAKGRANLRDDPLQRQPEILSHDQIDGSLQANFWSVQAPPREYAGDPLSVSPSHCTTRDSIG